MDDNCVLIFRIQIPYANFPYSKYSAANEWGLLACNAVRDERYVSLVDRKNFSV